jgi:hypothetical protein
MADIDMWGKDCKDADDADFDFGGSSKEFGDDFTVATVSTGHSFSGHSRSTQGSHSNSGSTISSHGSTKSSRTCLIEDLSRPQRRHEKPEKSRSRRRDLGENGRSSSKRDLLQAVPKKTYSIKDLKDDEQTQASERSKQRHDSSTSSVKSENPRSSRRTLLAENGKSPSLRGLTKQRQRSSKSLCPEEDKPTPAAAGMDKRASLMRSQSMIFSRSSRKIGSLDDSMSNMTLSVKSENPRSSRITLLAENGKSSSLRGLTKQRQRSSSKSLCLEEDKPTPAAAETSLESRTVVSESSGDIFEVLSRTDPKKSGMDNRASLMRSQSMIFSRNSRKLGSLDDSSMSNMSCNFQKPSGSRPSLGRSTSFKMSVKMQSVGSPEEPKNSDEPKSEEQNPASMPRNLGRCDSSGGASHRKPRRIMPGESGKPGLPPTTTPSRTRNKRTTSSRSNSLASGTESARLPTGRTEES